MGGGAGRVRKGGVRGEAFGSAVSERHRLHCMCSYKYPCHIELNPAQPIRTCVHSVECLNPVLSSSKPQTYSVLRVCPKLLKLKTKATLKLT